MKLSTRLKIEDAISGLPLSLPLIAIGILLVWASPGLVMVSPSLEPAAPTVKWAGWIVVVGASVGQAIASIVFLIRPDFLKR